MCMLMDSTILGIGGPELFVILAVGYFALGPVELFRLTKAAGVLVGQLKDIGLGTATNLGNIMNDQVSMIWRSHELFVFEDCVGECDEWRRSTRSS